MTRTQHETPVHIAVYSHLMAVLPVAASRTLIHIPNGENRTAKTGSFLKRLGVKPGVEDLQFFYEGTPYCVEVKPKGGYQSREQKDRQADVVAAGAFYAVVRSIDDVRELLAHWGIPSREKLPQATQGAG